MTSFFMGNEPYCQGANYAEQYFKRKSPKVLYPQGLGFGKKTREILNHFSVKAKL